MDILRVSLFTVIFLVFCNVTFASDVMELSDNNSNLLSDYYYINDNTYSLMSSSYSSGIFSADNYTTGFFDNYNYFIENNFISSDLLTDNNLNTYVTFNSYRESVSIKQMLTFNKLLNLDSFFLDLRHIKGNLVNLNIRFLGRNNVLLREIVYKTSFNGYENLNLKNVSAIQIYMSGTPQEKNEVIFNIHELDFFLNPSSFFESVIDLNLFDLKHNAVSFKWKNPIDEKFKSIRVYLDDVLLTESTIINYNLKELEPETNYKLTVSAVYGDGIEVFKDYYFLTKSDPGDIYPPDNITNLNLVSGFKDVSLSWSASQSDDVDYYEIYRNNTLIVSNLKDLSYFDDGLEELTTYIYKVSAVDTSGNKNLGVSKSIKTLSSKDNKSPSDVSNLAVVEDYTQTNMRMSTFGIKQINALVTYDLPNDDDFSHVEILRDDNLLNATVSSNRYMDLNIGEKQTYKYTVKSIDTNGNKSTGVSVNLNTTFIPDKVAPAAPIGLNISRNNGGGKLNWQKNSDSDLDGYNVYVNGTKYNTDLVKTLSQVLKNLENGTTYQLTVTAVDWSGNESAHSAAIDLVPDKNASTDVNLNENYNLKDITDGTANWFASLWWIVAFVVGIALAFILGRRFKELFLGS